MFEPGTIVMTTLSGYLVKVIDGKGNRSMFSGMVVGKVDSPEFTSSETYEMGHISHGWGKSFFVIHKPIFKTLKLI